MFDRLLTIQHRGGEYFSINISSFKNNNDEIWPVLQRAETVMRKPSSTRNIALQILDTKLSKESFDKLTEWLKKMNSNIFRLVIIGARFRDKWLLNKIMKRKFLKLNMQYIYDWDTAKDWLVGKRK